MRTNCVLALVLVCAVAPAMLAADEAPTKDEFQASEKNLKKIGRAFHDAHDALEVLPGDILDKEGKPLLSWRVAILPYLGEDKLYKEFKLDEPWDSKHNLKLAAKMPAVYEPVRAKTDPRLTYYQSFYGPKTLFDPKAKKRPTLAWISQNNGTSNTVLVLEAGVATAWTRPLDLPFDEKEALPKLGRMFDGDFHALFCDGSVQLLKHTIRERALKCALQPENNEVIEFYDR